MAMQIRQATWCLSYKMQAVFLVCYNANLHKDRDNAFNWVLARSNFGRFAESLRGEFNVTCSLKSDATPTTGTKARFEALFVMFSNVIGPLLCCPCQAIFLISQKDVSN